MTNLKESYGSMMDHWAKVMPNFKPRKSQELTFEWMENLSPDVKYILLEMPVGGGKSPIGLVMSSWLSRSAGSSYILTPQKILQKQYEDSFSKNLLFSLYGKNNYQCVFKDCSCEVGSSIKPKCDSCPYKDALAIAKYIPNLILNYKLGLLLFLYTAMPSRKLMVMDECHNLENQLVDLTTFSISDKLCKKIGIKYASFNHIIDTRDWIATEYFPKLIQLVSRLCKEVDKIEAYSVRKISLTEQNIIKDFIKFKRHAALIEEVLISDRNTLDTRFVLINENKYFTFKELYGGNAFHRIIKPQTEKFLLMSSTILNKDGFCRDLHIKPEEAAFLSLDSEFSRDKRTVFYKPVAKMSYGWEKDDRRSDRIRLITTIRDILSYHENESGIIHTGSFKIANWLVDELVTHKTHLILHHNPTEDAIVKRDDIIDEYMNTANIKPIVLISPSITEGLDLKDDFGRFAIFAKVPYPNLGDAWIKRRMEISNDWYRRQTLKSIIQGGGRICRSHDDWGVIYILDESFTFLYNRTKKNVIPKWWADGLEFL